MIKKIILLVFLLGIAFSFSYSSTSAETSSLPECRDQNLDLNQCIDYLKNKVSEKQGQAKTLSSQIAIMDNQIKLTQARIEQTRKDILDVTLDIDTATKKISTLQDSLEKITEVLINRIVVTYETGRVEPLEVLLTSPNASKLFSRLNYLRIVQAHDKKLVYEVQQAKNDYTNQKEIFEDKKKKEEALKLSLEKYTAQLATERKNKDNLLAITKNDEVKYQQLLAQAQAERAIIFGGGVDSYLRDVNQGDTIGTIALHSSSPGCSTGAHLHFEIQKDGSVQNPNSYLKSITPSYPSGYDQSYYGSVNPSGDLTWPLNEPIIIHQGYGSHGYAQTAYSGGVHTGIDMDSGSWQVKAVKVGKLYGGSITCSYPLSGKLYYAKIIHDGGLVTWYLHMIPN